MSNHFFGYGSLVNKATHSYLAPKRASLPGWRRAWVHTEIRSQSFLSVVRDPSCSILGLVAEVPGGDWSALDAREIGYARNADHAQLESGPKPVQVYAIPNSDQRPASHDNPILLSYLDAVIQGFFAEYGTDGVRHFWQTTQGWSAPVLNDRAAPQYPRAQRLSREELQLVDDGLSALGVTLI